MVDEGIERGYNLDTMIVAALSLIVAFPRTTKRRPSAKEKQPKWVDAVALEAQSALEVMPLTSALSPLII